MANLQVKNLPDELHDALRARAEREGRSLSDLVSTLLRREMALPAMADWLAENDDTVREHPAQGVVDVPALLDEVRGEPPR
jgi:plasmid stability protein